MMESWGFIDIMILPSLLGCLIKSLLRDCQRVSSTFVIMVLDMIRVRLFFIPPFPYIPYRLFTSKLVYP